MSNLTNQELADLSATHVMEWMKAWSPSINDVGWFEAIEEGGYQGIRSVKDWRPYGDWNDTMMLFGKLDYETELQVIKLLDKDSQCYWVIGDLDPRVLTELVLKAKGVI